jgi:hypothetical protein
MLFLRILQHLLPRSPTWSLTFNKTLQQFFAGLAAPFESSDPEESPRAFADAVFLDAFPSTTRQIPYWLKQFGLESSNDNVQQLTAAWQAQGGQSPRYLQDTLQLAGFPLFVHQWWKPGVPAFDPVCAGDTLAEAGEPDALCADRSFTYFARDPRAYTNQPITGSIEASDLSDQPQASDLPGQPQANAFLINEPGYLVNIDLSRNAPPPIPDDEAAFPYFFYLGGETFADHVTVPPGRRAELERLVLKLRPEHLWVVMLVDYVDVFDDTFDSTFA